MSRNSSRHSDSTPTTRSASVCAIAFFDMRADSGRIGFNHFPSLGDTAFGDSPSEMASAYARHAYAVSTFAAHSANFSRTLASLGAHRHASRNASIASTYASNPTHAAPSRYAAFPRHFPTLPPASVSAAFPILPNTMTPETATVGPPFGETLEGSFSAVSTPIFATKYTFCSIFRDLQDLHSFAPFFSEVGKPWKTHLKDLPNAAAFAARAAGQNQGCRKME